MTVTYYFNKNDSTIIGRGIVELTALESHSLQRSLDPKFVRDLATNLCSGVGLHYENALHVVPKESLSSDLRNQNETFRFPCDVKFLIIDGQHRWEALKRLKKGGHHKDNDEFFLCPVVVHSECACLLASKTGMLADRLP